MTRIFLCLISLAGFACRGYEPYVPAPGPRLIVEQSGGHPWVDTLRTVSDFVYKNLAATAPPEYFEQRKLRRDVRRSAFTNIAFEASSGDGLSGFLQIVKMQIELAFAVRHQSFEIQPNPEAAAFLKELGMKLEGIPLPDDPDVPPDLWKEEPE